MLEHIKQLTATYSAYVKLVAQVNEGTVRRSWIEDELLMVKGESFCAFCWGITEGIVERNS